MKLIKDNQYQTPQGILTYYGKVGRFTCEICGKIRETTYEFIANPSAYQQGFVGEWYHYGSECVKAVLPANKLISPDPEFMLRAGGARGDGENGNHRL